ncbi:MAG: putative DNA binding domain-containing protein [Bacilli bacterium]|nr:putative DNA binding domain-containing protein [Bacilli bacterium]
MEDFEITALIKKLQATKSETNTIEAKSSEKGFPKIYDTLSSFSNQDDGGVIVFGVDERKDFEVVGVYDVKDCTRKIAEACEQMTPNVRALISVALINNLSVVTAEVPGSQITDRPVFYTGKGKIKGSYVRVGDSDEPMSEYEVYDYESYKKRIKDDLRTIEDCDIGVFDEAKIDKYLFEVKKERNHVATNVDDRRILELTGVTKNGLPTLSGMMCFSLYPQTYFPQLCITAVVVPGLEMGDIGESGERFLDNKRITGPIDEMVSETVKFVDRNTKTRTVIDEDGVRRDTKEYPLVAVREAILNAIAHRDYSIYTENSPITLEIYEDRMEISNPGGLYGNFSAALLGEGRPETRNGVLVNILEMMKITENRYSGIPTIMRELRMAKLPNPEFEVKHGRFKVIFRNDYYALNKENDLKTAVELYCSTPRSREEITSFVGKSRFYTMSEIVQPLLEEGRLEMTMPDKPKSSFQKYKRK